MSASPAKFLFGFLFVSIILWLLFIFASRLLAWALSRVMGASVGFRVGGWKCLRDVVVKFRKGAIESVSIGEIKLSLRQSLVKLGVGFISRDPKLQVLICDLEIVIRPLNKNGQKAHSRRSRAAGRGKWMVVANMARFLSVSVTELVVRTPKTTIELKELCMDISKNGGSNAALLVRLNIMPIVVHLGELRSGCDQTLNRCVSQAPFSVMERAPAFFSCEEFFILCEFGHDREAGIIVNNVDIKSGELFVNIDGELFLKKKSSPVTLPHTDEVTESASSTKIEKKHLISAITKYASLIPERLVLKLPNLDIKFVHRGHNLLVENKIMGIQLKSVKSCAIEDIGESTRLDVQMDFGEIHLMREIGVSVVEILKLDVISLIYIPLQPTFPIRSEVDVKLGGTQCNMIMNRLKPWMQLDSLNKKKMVLREEKANVEKAKQVGSKGIMWTCTISAPEMTILLYNLSGVPIYHGCSQSSHVFANNISDTGTAIHLELGEFNLHMADEYQECLKESLFGVETNIGSLLHIAKISLDWGQRNTGESVEDALSSRFVLSVDVTGMGIYLTFKRIESLVSTAFSFRSWLKILSGSARKQAHRHREKPSKTPGKGLHLLKFNIEKCSLSFHGDVGLDSCVVADPKRVNYGSQGGRILVTVSADGTPRTANVMPIISNGYKKLNYSISLDIFQFSFCMNKEKQSTQLELERGRLIYEEFLEDKSPGTKVAFFDLQNAKFVRRVGGHKEIAVCSLFSATDIAVMWDPDVHIALFELIVQLKLLVHNQNLHGSENEYKEEVTSKLVNDQRNETSVDTIHESHHHRKRESIFAIDVEMLSITAEAGDGVRAVAQTHSLFSENACIGVLLEGLLLHLNDTQVFKSSRMQISRIPSISISISDAKTGMGNTFDWVIQVLDVHLCMPYRLQLRAIDDSVEDMLRALKLITTAKTELLLPKKKEPSKHVKSSTKVGCVKFNIRKLTADIEEEPIQGWLDEHYQLLKNEACELAVRMNLLDALTSRGNQCPGAETKDSVCEGKIKFGSEVMDLKDTSAINKFQEVLYEQSFRSYYHACQNLVVSEGSGAYKEGFQAGFKPSIARTSLFSVTVTELDVSLTKIDRGEAGMIDILQRLDPLCQVYDIPFSRLYGSKIFLHISSLVVQLRNYTFPLFSATSGRCDGCVVLAQQATCFQPQVYQNVFVGRWRKVQMLRSASGTTPPIKTYSDLPIHFKKAEISYGVGFEPAFTDISYAFTVALRRANLSIRDPNPPVQPPKKERSLPWWDEMRNYIHGKCSLYFSESKWNILATTDPYETSNKLQMVSGHMEIQQSDGRIYVSAKDFKILLSSLESVFKICTLKLPILVPNAFLETPDFTVEVTMLWDCESGNPLNHYLYALPSECVPREKIFDPFRSTSLSLRWNISLRPTIFTDSNQSQYSSLGVHPTSEEATDGVASKSENGIDDIPIFNVGPYDLAWLLNFWNLNYIPPHKLRTFSRWPRFGVARVPRSGNLSLDKVMTEFMFRIDSTPTCIRHMSLDDDDPAKGLTFDMDKLKYELCYSRGKQKYTIECKREPLDLVYQGLDLHVPKAHINRVDFTSVPKVVQMARKTTSQPASTDRVLNDKSPSTSSSREKHHDDGFLLSSDYFTIRRHSPKADPARLLAWQEGGRKNSEMTYVRSEFENGSESDEHTRSDLSDDDGYNVVIADNCQRIFVYGLKLLWTLENRDAVWSWVGGLSKAFESPKPSPSRQYAQRKLHEDDCALDGAETLHEDMSKSMSTCSVGSCSSSQQMETARSQSSLRSVKVNNLPPSAAVRNGNFDDSEEEGTRHFMVNVIEPQFNLHSEEANGRFLLAAVSGRVLARSFHSVLHVGYEMIEQALGGIGHIPESQPEMTWNRMEFSVMLEHVQAHVAPTDVDPGAGLQWLPKIRRSSPKVTRTGALLERVFMPCDMYFRYTRHKGGTADLKVKPLKELTFNSQNITATMTSRQFQVMLDVLTNLLFARLPKPRKSSLSCPAEDDDDVEEEADEVVPDGVEEVELARVNLEQKERAQKLLLDDIRKLSISGNPKSSGDLYSESEGHLWIISGGRSVLVHKLKKDLVNAQKSRKAASTSLRMALQKAAQLRLMEKEKNKSPSYAMRISLEIYKVVWGMLVDGKSFAEAEINDMVYDFDRDYKDVGIARFTTKYFVVRNCLPKAKCDMLLSAWSPPSEWGKKVMLRVDAKQGAPKDGNCPLELFQVVIYPLKIHLTEAMYRMMWEYFFPEEEQDSQRRQEVWKVSTTAGARRVKKGSSLMCEPSTSNSHSGKEFEVPKSTSQSSAHVDSSQASKLQNLKANIVCGSTPELRRTSSFDRTWEENVAESVANELVLQVHSSSVSSSKSGPLGTVDQPDESTRIKPKDLKLIKSGRSSHEEKKIGKTHEEKRSRPRKLREFHNIKISQVELLVTYEGSRFAVSDLRLLMDTFHRVEFTGTWRRLFSRVKKHIIWGVLKSVTGMQGKKFKDKAPSQRETNGAAIQDSDLNFSDSDGGSAGKSNQYPLSWPKRPSDGAGDGFVTSIRGLFNSQRRKAKAFVLRTMRGDADNELPGEWSESDIEFSPFARQLTITKAKRLIRRHTKKFRSRGQKGLTSQQRESHQSSPVGSTPFESDSSCGSSRYEDFQ